MSPRSRTSTPRLPFDDAAAPAAVGSAGRRGSRGGGRPARNVVLEASAGTGKTRVLVDRYINLLQARRRSGQHPRDHLHAQGRRRDARAHPARRSQRRGERARSTPARWRELRDRLGDIAISTIDAFCLSLLREFPLEADLDPGFAMADETEVPRLIDEALDRALRICRGLAASDEDVALVFAAARRAPAAGRPGRAARPAARRARRAATASSCTAPARPDRRRGLRAAPRRALPTRCASVRGRARRRFSPTARGSIRAFAMLAGDIEALAARGARPPDAGLTVACASSPTACAITS